jgi:hypothetical protein
MHPRTFPAHRSAMITGSHRSIGDVLGLGTAAEPEVRDPRPARTVFTRLLQCGLTVEEAGNLTARLAGLEWSATGWRPSEIQRLLFLRWLVETGRSRG